MISVTSETLTQIKGTRIEALFIRRWDKRTKRDGSSRVLLDIKPKCFGLLAEYLLDRKIAPPYFSLEVLYFGEEDYTVIQQLLS